ncbi:MAG: ECF-type sigma factor, partial [Dokdonella sp.]
LAEKRGGGVECVDIESLGESIDGANDAQLMRVDAALHDLSVSDRRRAQIVELVYFGGLSRAEVAATLDISEGTVDRDLRLARAWLKAELQA